MLSSFVMIIIGGLGATFGPQRAFGPIPSYVIYAISRFIIACGTRGINVTGFVLGKIRVKSQLIYPMEQSSFFWAFFFQEWRWWAHQDARLLASSLNTSSPSVSWFSSCSPISSEIGALFPWSPFCHVSSSWATSCKLEPPTIISRPHIANGLSFQAFCPSPQDGCSPRTAMRKLSRFSPRSPKTTNVSWANKLGRISFKDNRYALSLLRSIVLSRGG